MILFIPMGKKPTTYYLHQSQKGMKSTGYRELKNLVPHNLFLISTECNLIMKNFYITAP